MALTTSQIKSFMDAGEALQARKPVILTGNSNGKTTVLHNALEVLGQRDEVTGRLATTPKHPEDRTIDFFRVYFPPMPNVPNLMRQILSFAKVKPKHASADVVLQFDEFMRGMYSRGRVACLAVDNAEMIPTRAYTVLKALHEYHDPINRRSIGTGVLIAGDITKLKKIPTSFLLRSKEVLVGRLDEKEIAELIESLYPGHVRWFDAAALKRLTVCNTTLQMKTVIDGVVSERKKYRLAQISLDHVEEQLAELPSEPNQTYRVAA